MSGFAPIDVIREVKIRPGIYDRKALEPPNRSGQKQQLWVEVAESVTAPDEWENFTPEEKETRISEVTNKWKNLRDHFYREVKLIESGDSAKKRKYIYYDEMEFVRPYVGYKSAPKRKRMSKGLETSTDDYQVNDSDIDMDAFLKLSDDDIKVSPRKQSVSQSHSKKKYKIKSKQSVTDKTQQGEIKNFDLLRKKDGAKHSTYKVRESDISFCLSLVENLRELSGTRKLSAKIEILKVLHKNLDEIEQNENRTKDSEYTEYTVEECGYSGNDPLGSLKNN